MKGFGDLMAGYRRFREQKVSGEENRWRTLSEGQSPRAMVVACSDSRVDPATIFDTDPGEIFVVRNVANLVPPFEIGGGLHGVSAALEFAVTQLKVPEIIVMGHEHCGGIQAALTNRFADSPAGQGGFIARWMAQIEVPAMAIASTEGTGEDAARRLEEEAVRVSLRNLRSFPFVADREAAGSLVLIGCRFSISEGQLYLLDEGDNLFRPA